MSTSINGYVSELSTGDFFKLLTSMRVLINRQATREYSEWMVASFVEECDQNYILETDISSSFCDFKNRVFERQKAIKEKHTRDPEVDWDFELSFSYHDGKFFCIAFTEKPSLECMLKSKFQEYSYYNCTDKPDNISEEDWEKRYQDWNRVLPTWRPADTMAVFTLVDNLALRWEPFIPTLAKLPENSARIERMVQTAVREDYCRSNNPEENREWPFISRLLMNFEKEYHEGTETWNLREKYLDKATAWVDANPALELIKQ
jgi:hypothetical protein